MSPAAFADTVAYWNFNSLSIATPNPPGSGGVPTSIAADIGSGSISLTDWTGTVDDFAGSTLNTQASAPAGVSLSLIGTAGNGSHIDIQLNLSGYSDPVITYATQRTTTGFTTGSWSYSVAGGEFNAVPGGIVSPPASYAMATVDLSSLPDIDDESNVVLRYTLSGASAAAGNNRIDNLLLSATTTGEDTTPPLIASRTPADDATDVSADSLTQLTLVFNEDIVLGSGLILLKKVSDDSVVQSFDVEDLDQVDWNGNVLGLLDVTLESSTAYYVEIPNTAILDNAENAFLGISGNTGWNFTTADPPAAPSVVVNKYFNSGTDNGSGDMIELLVTGNGTPAAPVNLTGMIVKDFATSMTSDGGGKYEFTADTLWDDIPTGTLIVLSKSGTSTDTDATDFVVRIGLDDTTYFSNLGGTFNIANPEMVLIKAAGSGAAGTTGGIHALAGGTAGSFFTGFAGAKLLASNGAVTNQSVIANNSTGTIADFTSGTDATGGVALTPAAFGVANSGPNAAYIATLRGVDPSSGDGTATVVNATPASPFLNTGIFGRGLTGQSVSVTVNAFVPSVTLTDVTITVPAELGAPGSASLSGPGAAGAGSSILGQTVTISSAAATVSDNLVVTIGGLTTPTPSGMTDTGNYTFIVSSAGSGGTLTPIGIQPKAHVTVPLEVLRDVDANGVALDNGAVVAIEGVCTMGNFSLTNTQAYLQDSTAGINLFNSALLTTPLVRGNRYAALGTIQQFNGLTEIVPSSESDIINLGTGTEPAAQIITAPVLPTVAEALEGSLVTVENLVKVSGNWTGGQNVTLKDASNNEVVIRIQPASTALPEPAYPLTVTGVLTQSDNSNPFTAGYQILPRDNGDLALGSLGDFDTWAATTGATGGMTGDTDFDGQDNAFEYAFGLNPTSGSSVNPFVVPLDKATGKFSFTRRKTSLSGLAYKVFTSTTLSGWTQDLTATLNVTGTTGDIETVEATLTPALLAEPKLFLRVVAE